MERILENVHASKTKESLYFYKFYTGRLSF
jgi:hypothetical protein